MRILRSFRELFQYPSAVIGLIIILVLVVVSIITIFAIPYDEAIRLWRGGEDVWYNSPKTASPKYVNWFRSSKLPETLTLSTADGDVEKIYEPRETTTKIVIPYVFDFKYDIFPDELALFFDSRFNEKLPHVNITWYTPDGREIRVASFAAEPKLSYRVSQDEKLIRRLKGQLPQIGLFADPNSDPEDPVPLKGIYEMQVEVTIFEEGDDVDAEFVMFGKVAGWAGTDHRRRDLSIAMLWGTPIALAFGLLAAVGTTITTMIIAAFGVWYGGWVDELIQRITEVNLILPVLPILIMVGTFYSKSLWLMLGVIILLSIFGGGIKTYRAIFLQVKASPYIEAARAYGAGNARIIFSYLIPRIIPLLLPQFVILVPSFVFLEAALAFLGLGDPMLPTWGKVINEANANGALHVGHYYWVLQPSILLMLTGLAFAMLGYSLDRVFNPRLRGL
ncbi:MAG: ABC transporter permease [Anaerolineales bacterium]|jgi:peptide/nickel transport system permease protein